MAERFKKPTSDQYVGIAILFNEGHLDTAKLADMISFCEFIVDRLYDNGDAGIPSLREKEIEKENEN